jgi:hypothetical protein
MSIPNFPLDFIQGATFSNTFHWYAGGRFMAPIEEITIGYPTIVKVTAHGLPTISDTPIILSSIEGCTILNSKELGIEEGAWVDVDHFEMPVSTVKDPWTVGSGEMTYFKPTDITGFTARMHVKERWQSDEILIDLTTENGGILLTVEDASIVLTIQPAVTQALKIKKGVYSVEMISPGADITRIFEGVVVVHREVTT